MIRSACILAALLAVSLADGQEPITAIDKSYQAAVKRNYAAKSQAEEKTASEEFQAPRGSTAEPAGTEPGSSRVAGHPAR